jgi:hypothetical protein
MEHLWSRAVATASKRWQMGRPRKWLKQAKTVAVGCYRLPPTSMVRRGSVRVRQRALQKRRKAALFVSRELARSPKALFPNQAWVETLITNDMNVSRRPLAHMHPL